MPTAEQLAVPMLRELDTVSYLAGAQERARPKVSAPDEMSPDAHLNALADASGAWFAETVSADQPQVLAPDDEVAGAAALDTAAPVTSTARTTSRRRRRTRLRSPPTLKQQIRTAQGSGTPTPRLSMTTAGNGSPR